MNHEMVDGIGKRRKPFTVDYTGFGWVLIKNGVFENEQMKYPWFAPKMQVFESGLFRTCVVKTFPSVWMPLKLDLRSGVILEFVLVTRRHALFESSMYISDCILISLPVKSVTG